MPKCLSSVHMSGYFIDPRVTSKATKRNRIAKWEKEIIEGVSGVGPHQYFMIIIAEQVYNLFLISPEQI